MHSRGNFLGGMGAFTSDKLEGLGNTFLAVGHLGRFVFEKVEGSGFWWVWWW